MSAAVVVILVTALVLGLVGAMFAGVYLWDEYVEGTRLEQRVDRFFDRISDILNR